METVEEIGIGVNRLTHNFGNVFVKRVRIPRGGTEPRSNGVAAHDQFKAAAAKISKRFDLTANGAGKA